MWRQSFYVRIIGPCGITSYKVILPNRNRFLPTIFMYSPVAHFVQKCILADLVETRTIDRNLMIMLGPAVFHKTKREMQEVSLQLLRHHHQDTYVQCKDGRVAQVLHGLLKPDTFTAFSRVTGGA